MRQPTSFRPWQPDQTTLLPPSPREWLADDHQVYFLLDLVDELDLSAILRPAQTKDPRGEKGFAPRMFGEAFRVPVDDADALRLLRGDGVIPQVQARLLREPGLPGADR